MKYFPPEMVKDHGTACEQAVVFQGFKIFFKNKLKILAKPDLPKIAASQQGSNSGKKETIIPLLS